VAGNGGFGQTNRTGLAMPKVAVYAAAATTGSAAYGLSLQNALKGTNLFSTVDLFNVSSAGTGAATPTLAQMQAYDAVAVVTYQGVTPTLGDNLAAYFESGGGVVLFDYEAQALGTSMLQGRFASQYTLATPILQTSFLFAASNTVALGTIDEPASPIMSGVASGAAGFGYKGTQPYHMPSSAFNLNGPNSPVVVAHFSDGTPAVVRGTAPPGIVYGRHLVEINGFGASNVSTAGAGGSTTMGWDSTSTGATLIANALVYTMPVQSVGVVASLDFGTEALYTPSAPQAVTYTNGSSVAQTITAISLSGTQIGDFAAVPSGGLPVTLPPNGTFVVNVTFAPSDTGLRAATLGAVIQGAGTATTALTGTGM
jgi:hypothetical protein